MAKKLTLITFILSLCSGIVFSEDIQEIVILEKKLSSLNGWSDNQSITSISQKELDGQAWPKLNSKTHLLFILSYDMDGFLALVKFIIDRKTGTVSLEEIAD